MNQERGAKHHLTTDESHIIKLAVDRGIATYVASRKAKIPEFLERHFSFRGALALQRKTLGRDIFRIPINMLWSLPVFLAQVAASVSERLGARRVSRLFERLPPGLKTASQREVNWLVQTELLELPYYEQGRSSTKDALLSAILNDPELSEQCANYLTLIEQKSQKQGFRESLEKHLTEYGKSQMAVSELSGNILILAAGFAAFRQATPGALSAGSAMAAVIAQHAAISNFWLGPALGAWFYSVFPASASLGLVAASTGVMMAATGILAALSMVIIDPLLAKTGFHQRRLERFIEALEGELTGDSEVRYRVYDHYAARVIDLLDLLKLAAQAARRVV